MSQHEQANTRGKPFSCSHCEEIFTQAVELSKYKQAYKSDKPLSCSHCEKSFVKAAELSQEADNSGKDLSIGH